MPTRHAYADRIRKVSKGSPAGEKRLTQLLPTRLRVLLPYPRQAISLREPLLTHQKENRMNRVWSSTLMVVSLVLMLAGAPSWGQVPRSNDTSDFAGNTGGGFGALSNNTPSTSTNDGHFNTAYGNGTLFRNTIGQQNAAFGLNALNANTTGGFNTASGVGALQSNTTGEQNTASGFRALWQNTSGGGNTASGVDALESNTSGGGNTASGASALNANTIGTFNTASGVDALRFNTTGNFNTASGVDALLTNTTGTNNTATGVLALASNTTGSNNIAVGERAGQILQSGNNNIYLGNRGGEVMENGIIRIGTPGTHTRTFLAGSVFVESFTPSDARLKTHVTPLTHVLEQLEHLRGVSFEWNDAAASLMGHKPGQRDIGVIAQEVEAVFPELITAWGKEGYKAVAYEKLTGVLLAAVKELKAAMDAQHQELGAHARQLADLKAQNASLRVALGQLVALQTQHQRLQATVEQLQVRAETQRATTAALAEH